MSFSFYVPIVGRTMCAERRTGEPENRRILENRGCDMVIGSVGDDGNAVCVMCSRYVYVMHA